MVELAANIWADGPAQSPYEPPKHLIRQWGTWLEGLVQAFISGGGRIYATRAALNADLTQSANTMAWVVEDPVAGNNGVFRKVGASGAGSWVRAADLPYSFIVAEDTGEGTPNAIEAESSIPINSSALVFLNVYEANTGSPVTVSFNGAPPLIVKSNSGNDIQPGGFASGMVLLGRVSGGTFQLVSDQASAAILAAAEDAATLAVAAAEEASQYADFAKDNWVVALSVVGNDAAQTDFPLSIDPGSKNNMFVSVGGILQNTASYDLIDDGGPVLRLAEPLPEFASLEVRAGNATEVGVPGNGTVGTPQLADKGTTLAKIQDVPAQRFVGRLTASDGPLELLTAEQLQSLLSAPGTLVDSKYARYTTKVALSVQLPADGSIPQATEGTEVLSVTITPKAVGNKFRVRFRGFGSVDAAPNNLCYAIFRSGSNNALDAGGITFATAGQVAQMAGEAEYTAAAITPITFSVRVGPSIVPSSAYLNGSAANQQFSTAGGATLVVEEIKG